MAGPNPFLTALVPAGLLSVGAYLQSRDQNTTGSDDAFGRLFITLAPSVSAALDNTLTTKTETRILTAIRDGAQARLDEIAASGK